MRKKKQIEIFVSEIENGPEYGRNGHTSFVYQDSIYIFAGRIPFGRRAYTNELMRLDLDEEKKSVVSVSVVETSSEEGELVYPRFGHGSCLYENRFYSFGGSGGNGYQSLEEVLVLDIEEMKYYKLVAKNPPEPSRHGHTCELFDSKVWMFGGHYREFKTKNKKRTFFSDVIMFDLEKKSYFKIKARGDRPRKRSWSSSALLKHHMIIFGGFLKFEDRSEVYFNDIYTFCLKTLIWTELQQKGDVPGVRNRSTLTKIGKNVFILFGGNHFVNGKNVWYDDVFAVHIDVSKNIARWKKLGVEVVSVRREYPTSHHIAERFGNRIFIWGGEIHMQRPTHITALRILEQKQMKKEK